MTHHNRTLDDYLLPEADMMQDFFARERDALEATFKHQDESYHHADEDRQVHLAETASENFIIIQ